MYYNSNAVCKARVQSGRGRTLVSWPGGSIKPHAGQSGGSRGGGSSLHCSTGTEAAHQAGSSGWQGKGGLFLFCIKKKWGWELQRKLAACPLQMGLMGTESNSCIRDNLIVFSQFLASPRALPALLVLAWWEKQATAAEHLLSLSWNA